MYHPASYYVSSRYFSQKIAVQSLIASLGIVPGIVVCHSAVNHLVPLLLAVKIDMFE